MNWEEWIRKNNHNFEKIDPYGYKQRFVYHVLAEIDEITPENTFFHYPLKGTDRYVNFVIINKEKNQKLPIEIDAFQTVKGSYPDFNEFLERQNELISEFGILLRFSNIQADKIPWQLINKVKNILTLQQQGQVTKETVNGELQKSIEQYKEQLKNISTELDITKTKLIQAQIEKAEAEKARLKAEYNSKNTEEKFIRAEQNSKNAERKRIEEETKRRVEERKRKEAEKARDEEMRKTEEVGDKIDNLAKSLENITGVPVTTSPAPQKSSKLPYILTALVATGAVGYFLLSQNNAPKNQVPISQSPIAVAPVNEPIAQSHPVMTTQTEDDSMPSIFDSAITPWTAKNYIGKNVPVCGYVAEVKKFSKGVYLNFEKRYPNQPFSAVIWDSNYSLIRKSSQLAQTELCVTGKISTYKGNPRVNINSEKQIIQ